MADEEAYEFFTPAAWLDHRLTEQRTLDYLRGAWRESDVRIVGNPPLPDPPDDSTSWIVIDEWRRGAERHRHWTQLAMKVPSDLGEFTHFFYPSRPLLNPDSAATKRSQISDSLRRENRNALPGYFARFPLRAAEGPTLSQESLLAEKLVQGVICRPWPKGLPYPYGDQTVHYRPGAHTVADPEPQDVDRLVVYASDTTLAWRSIQNEVRWVILFDRVSKREAEDAGISLEKDGR